MSKMVRSEFPRPQLTRSADSWVNLNGEWDFEFDHGCSGKDRKMFSGNAVYSNKIIVPFCPESRFSGVEYKDFMRCVWYRRRCALPEGWNTDTGRVLLHFGAVDYFAEVWVNDTYAGSHRGGYSSWQLDVTEALGGQREFRLTVRAEDDVRSPIQPSGKQHGRYYSEGCMYTRTTGIWQTVWLEYVPKYYIRHLFLTPDVKNEKLSVRVRPERYVAPDSVVTAVVRDGEKEIASVSAKAGWGETEIIVPVKDPKLWEPGAPFLYDLDVKLSAPGEMPDTVHSYFGMRSVEVTPRCILINGKPVFQRLVLDQGFYPDGVYTAPSDEELKADIERSMRHGFNGARLHQKVFEQRFLYWADRLGYLCWEEHANWGFDVKNPAFFTSFMNEWCEVVERDYSSPAIIGWCPFNETEKGDDTLGSIYRLTKRLDPSRPVIDTSGWFHNIQPDGRAGTDVWDFHDYEQDPAKMAEKLRPYSEGVTPPHSPVTDARAWVKDTPYFCSEFGGTWWAQKDATGWGYGATPEEIEEFYRRFEGLTAVMLGDPDMCAFCYTQLTDVEFELNGIYTYERRPKFDADRIRAAVTRKAKIEENN